MHIEAGGPILPFVYKILWFYRWTLLKLKKSTYEIFNTWRYSQLIFILTTNYLNDSIYSHYVQYYIIVVTFRVRKSYCIQHGRGDSPWSVLFRSKILYCSVSLQYWPLAYQDIRKLVLIIEYQLPPFLLAKFSIDMSMDRRDAISGWKFPTIFIYTASAPDWCELRDEIIHL